MKTYVDVSLPKDLVDEMDKLVGQYGFRSRPEIAKEAIRQLLFRYTFTPTPKVEVSQIQAEGD